MCIFLSLSPFFSLFLCIDVYSVRVRVAFAQTHSRNWIAMYIRFFGIQLVSYTWVLESHSSHAHFDIPNLDYASVIYVSYRPHRDSPKKVR